MCGRYALFGSAQRIQAQFRASNMIEGIARYNIAPTEKVPILRLDSEYKRYFSMATWGWKPSEKAPGSLLINARAETLHEKPTFKTAARFERCVLPADGFYEWERQGIVKTPWYFTDTRAGHALALAGLFRSFESEGELRLETLIVTAPANSLVGALHDRMPVILPANQIQDWLNPNLAYPLAQAVRASDAMSMSSKPVSKALNQAGTEGVELHTPDLPRQPSLF